MPGISLKCVPYTKDIEDSDVDYQEFLKALNSTLYNDCYELEILLKETPYLLGCTRYSQYPVRIVENTSAIWICLEGKIYGKKEEVVNIEIIELVNRIFSNELTREDKRIIADWLLQTDGDFVIYALNKNTKDFIIMNDVLGRLPLYYYWKQGQEMILSRELPFISYLTQENKDNGNKFDKMGIAQYLLIGHALGKRTLVTNINRLEPATILRIINNTEIKIDNIYRLNFENKKYVNLSIKKNAEELVSLFSKACKNRAENNAENIILLSGGFDSRCVLASFHKNKIPGFGATLLDSGWTPIVGNTSEAQVAKLLAKSLKFEWENYDFIRPRAEDLLKLLRMKNGFLYLAFSYLLPSLENLKHIHDSSTNRIVTGHGGEIIRADPLRIQIKDMDTLVKIIIQGTGSFSLNDVSDLVQIKKSEIVDEIRNTLSSYPEKDLNKKFMHFLYCEIEPKLAFETEDLYRFYFWTTSPYYSIPFFIYAMNCPDENKSKDALYREFLVMLSPSAAAISMSNWGCSILSKKYKFLQFIYSLMWRYLRFYRIIVSILSFMWKHPKLNRIMIKKDNRFYKDNSRIIRCIREQIKSCHNISNYLSSITTEKILNNYSNLSRVGIYKLFTITLLIEETFCNNNTIDKCYDD